MYRLLIAIVLLLSCENLGLAQTVKHSFLACGGETYIMDQDGKRTWTFAQSTRDGYVQPDGTIILAVNQSSSYPGGSVIEVKADGTEKVIWKGSQSEVNSVQPTADGNFVITEAGPLPRLLEVDRQGKIVTDFALDCQKENHHMQTRMARKLQDGTFLVPHLLDFAVRQYSAGGKVILSFDTTVQGDPERKIHSWPFTAIRQGNGRTMVCLTNGNRVVELDAGGKVVWQLTNDDLPGPWLQDPCGCQVLPNGNVVITSYAGGRKDPNAPKLIEVNRDKKVIWTHVDGKQSGIHHFQILDTNGQKLDGIPLK